jgi:hypothetical protein
VKMLPPAASVRLGSSLVFFLLQCSVVSTICLSLSSVYMLALWHQPYGLCCFLACVFGPLPPPTVTHTLWNSELTLE